MVAAIRSETGASKRLLLAALQRRVEMLVSVPLFLEYEAVLTRREHLQASGLDIEDVHSLLATVSAAMTAVHSRFSWRPMLHDAADEMVLDTAVNGCADVLVTFNLRHFTGAAKTFGIRVLRPADAWKEIRDDT